MKAATGVEFRMPTPEDAAAVHEIAASDGAVDTNSSYCYALWFHEFSEGSVVATADAEVIGYLLGYRRPPSPTTYFVWQFACRREHDDLRLRFEILDHALRRQASCGAKSLEITAAPDDETMPLVLKRLASAHSGTFEDLGVVFPAELFPDGHHDEVGYRVGLG